MIEAHHAMADAGMITAHPMIVATEETEDRHHHAMALIEGHHHVMEEMIDQGIEMFQQPCLYVTSPTAPLRNH